MYRGRHTGGVLCLAMRPYAISTDTARVKHDSPNAVVVWTLWKAGQPAQCIVCPVGDRVELHITMTEEVVVSQQCRGPEQAAFLSNTWLEALKSRGWRDATSVLLES